MSSPYLILLSVLVPFFIISIPVLLKKPYWTLCLFLFLLPFEGLPLFTGATVIRMFGIFLFVNCTIFFLFYRKRVVFFDRENVIYLLFIMWSLLSFIWSENLESNFERNLTYMMLFALYLIVKFLPLHDNIILMYKSYCIGLIITLTAMFLYNHALFGYGRISFYGFNTNDYAALLALSTNLLFSWYLIEKKLFYKILIIIFLSSVILGVLGTMSRTGLLTLVPFVVFLTYALITNKDIFLRIWVLSSVGIVCIFFFNSQYSVFDRLFSFGIDTTAGFSGRTDVWDAGFRMFLDNSFLGVGTGNFPFMSESYSLVYLNRGNVVAHNSFLAIACELGIVGLLLFVLLIKKHMSLLLTVFFSSEQKFYKIFSLGLFFSIFSYIIASLGLSWEYQKILPLLLGTSSLLYVQFVGKSTLATQQ